MMPDRDGYAVLQAVRTNKITATTPFIFFTAKGEKGDLRAGMNLGADDYMVKPTPRSFRALLDSEGFRFTKAYAFHASRFGIWIRISPDPPLRLFYLSKQAAGTVCEFITLLCDEASLTTTTTRAAFVFPRPFGSFLQSFPKTKPADLWQAHLQGEKYLTSALGIRAEECQLAFLDGFKRDVVRRLSYVTSLRLWCLRGIYWYLVKRFLLHNRPIWEQDVSELYRHAA